MKLLVVKSVKAVRKAKLKFEFKLSKEVKEDPKRFLLSQQLIELTVNQVNMLVELIC